MHYRYGLLFSHWDGRFCTRVGMLKDLSHHFVNLGLRNVREGTIKVKTKEGSTRYMISIARILITNWKHGIKHLLLGWLGYVNLSSFLQPKVFYENAHLLNILFAPSSPISLIGFDCGENVWFTKRRSLLMLVVVIDYKTSLRTYIFIAFNFTKWRIRMLWLNNLICRVRPMCRCQVSLLFRYSSVNML